MFLPLFWKFVGLKTKKNKAKCNPKCNPKRNISFLQGQKCNPKRNPKCNPKPNFRPFTDTKKPVPATHIPERAFKTVQNSFKCGLISVLAVEKLARGQNKSGQISRPQSFVNKTPSATKKSPEKPQNKPQKPRSPGTQPSM